MKIQVRKYWAVYKLRLLLCTLDRSRDPLKVMVMSKQKVLEALIKRKEVVDCITQYAEKRMEEL